MSAQGGMYIENGQAVFVFPTDSHGYYTVRFGLVQLREFIVKCEMLAEALEDEHAKA